MYYRVAKTFNSIDGSNFPSTFKFFSVSAKKSGDVTDLQIGVKVVTCYMFHCCCDFLVLLSSIMHIIWIY